MLEKPLFQQVTHRRKHVQDIATKGSSKASLKRNYRGAFHLAMFNFHGVSHGSCSTAISDGAAQPCI
ncbi:hypothetical protein AAC387_Pa04g2559 [Persea americana]